MALLKLSEHRGRWWESRSCCLGEGCRLEGTQCAPPVSESGERHCRCTQQGRRDSGGRAGGHKNVLKEKQREQHVQSLQKPDGGWVEKRVWVS